MIHRVDTAYDFLAMEKSPMSLKMLAENLALQFQEPQKSERWAMYRVIMPVVDHAEKERPRTACFEYNQTSRHGTSQSVDVALLANGEEEVFLEAKAIGKFISSDQIAKYLVAGVRGLVSNGIDWILCVDGQNIHIRIYDSAQQMVNLAELEEVVSFIRGGDPATAVEDWTHETLVRRPAIIPARPAKEERARRTSNPAQAISDAEALSEVVGILPASPVNERALLDAIVERFKVLGNIPPEMVCEWRTSRVTFSKNGTRIGRIEFGATKPDILLLTSLVERLRKIGDGVSALEKVAPSSPHSKGPHFRRFRIRNEDQARLFGGHFVDALLAAE